MGGNIGYPSPQRSESPEVTADIPFPKETEMAQDVSSVTVESARPRLAVRRTREPPKNATGQIYCDHPDCHDHIPYFKRPCEWNKHMDKHDRPYKCTNPDCNKMLGFTYSGGLLRHQREVHKMNSQGKKLLCPYPDCNRSSGKGFTRQENLKEHLRRLHRGGDGRSPDDPISLEANEPENSPVLLPLHPSKRKRHTSESYSSSEEEGSNPFDLRDEITRLRREVIKKDSRLDELEKELKQLRRLIQNG
ncbi:C2H2 transcription factor [Histoplasma capsulatum]|uniref:C2H2 transcription factor n=2 Tax=Histoplasma TaxID=5036 RepID=A0A8A1M1K9_AJECA|nr:C2H2 transcription factor [Histoplasma capsulatum]